MSPDKILDLYLVVWALQLLFELGLICLNLSYVRANRDKLPSFLGENIDGDTYRKSVSYTLTKGRFSILAGVYSSLVLLIWILSGAFGKLDHWVSSFGFGDATTGVVYILIFSLITSIISLPLSLYSTFVIEEKFGFNKMSFKLWCLDLIKSMLLSMVLLTPILYGLFWFMGSSGAYWWFYAFLFLAGFQIILLVLYPSLIAPLFNKFTPLSEGELNKAILALSAELGFRTSGVFLMDGSKRSAHGNAYFTGFGSLKRIVLFDTLVNQLEQKETLAVLAHEIGHEKKGHIKKSLLLSLCAMLFGFWILSLLIGYQPLYLAFGFSAKSLHAALLIFIFVSSPFSYFLSPLFSVLSRRFEYQADAFAAKAVGSAAPLISALLNLSKNSLSNFTPHPLYSFFHYSHPTLAERITAMQSLES